MIKEATSRPISISDDIVQRVAPFHYHSIKKYESSYSHPPWNDSRSFYISFKKLLAITWTLVPRTKLFFILFYNKKNKNIDKDIINKPLA
ncbi:unnamed protein product, partial [Vitis vinifera]